DSLLEAGDGGLAGRQLAEAVPEFIELFDTARGGGTTAADISRRTLSGETQTLAVRFTADSGPIRNYILTFDDITQQIADQRRAAWSDVARRIAHEIKNPLTPIILSAERLKRRFGKQIGDGRETFDQLTETIIRQVGDLRRMVDEFSAFARMPAPGFRPENIGEIVSQAVFLAEVGNPDIRFWLEVEEDLPEFVCDRRHIAQAVANLIKNAAESIHEKPGGPTDQDEVAIIVGIDGGRLRLTISDTGIGIPAELRERLFEPYVTTRARGTGLGLAIVKRIVEDHHGRLELVNRESGGAMARMDFDLALNRGLVLASAPPPTEIERV
ncbi:MAG: ATP-binding protein, partial [Sphingomonadaceae bacterium]